jgi:hypothetical protein
MNKENKIDIFDIIEEEIISNHFIKENNNYYYVSPFKGKIKIIGCNILPNYDDIELIQIRDTNNFQIILRPIGSFLKDDLIKKSKNVKILHPKGDMVCFILENGKQLYIDSAEDWSGELFSFLKDININCPSKQYGGKLTNLKGIHGDKIDKYEYIPTEEELLKIKQKKLPKDFNLLIEIKSHLDKTPLTFTINETILDMIILSSLSAGIKIVTSLLCINTYNEIEQLIYYLKKLGLSYIHLYDIKQWNKNYLQKNLWIIIDDAENWPRKFFDDIIRWFDKDIYQSSGGSNITFIFDIKNNLQFTNCLSKSRDASIPIVITKEHIKSKSMIES